MKQLLFLSFFVLVWNKYHTIYETNSLKEEAKEYYLEKKFSNCIPLYEKLISQYDAQDEQIKLNLAHCYYQIGKNNLALENYKSLTNSSSSEIRSTAFLQLGIIYSTLEKQETSLNYFKSALKSNPNNELARFNFELQKQTIENRKLPENIEKKKENENGKQKQKTTVREELRNTPTKKSENTTNQKNQQDYENESSGDFEEDEFQFNKTGDKETEALTTKRLKEVNLSLQQAKAILKEMQSAEIQYLQQQQKVINTENNSGKPNW